MVGWGEVTGKSMLPKGLLDKLYCLRYDGLIFLQYIPGPLFPLILRSPYVMSVEGMDISALN